MKRLILIIVLLAIIAIPVQAQTPLERVSWRCGYSAPIYAELTTPGGDTILLDEIEVTLLMGRERPNATGIYHGNLFILNIATSSVVNIGVYRHDGRWDFACDNGVNMRIYSPYLDCAILGECG